MKATKKEIKDILQATFPKYAGRKFNIDFSTRIWVDRIGGGGSRDEVCIAGHDGTKWVSKYPEASRLDAPCGYIEIDPRFIYAVHSFFCGTDCGITFHIHPESKYKPSMIAQVKEEENDKM
jgi:hypothetical protein